jgi:hypothetical protein
MHRSSALCGHISLEMARANLLQKLLNFDLLLTGAHAHSQLAKRAQCTLYTPAEWHFHLYTMQSIPLQGAAAVDLSLVIWPRCGNLILFHYSPPVFLLYLLTKDATFLLRELIENFCMCNGIEQILLAL